MLQRANPSGSNEIVFTLRAQYDPRSRAEFEAMKRDAMAVNSAVNRGPMQLPGVAPGVAAGAVGAPWPTSPMGAGPQTTSTYQLPASQPRPASPMAGQQLFRRALWISSIGEFDAASGPRERMNEIRRIEQTSLFNRQKEEAEHQAALKRNEELKQSFVQVASGITNVARAYVYLGFVGEQNIEKTLKSLAKLEAVAAGARGAVTAGQGIGGLVGGARGARIGRNVGLGVASLGVGAAVGDFIRNTDFWQDNVVGRTPMERYEDRVASGELPDASGNRLSQIQNAIARDQAIREAMRQRGNESSWSMFDVTQENLLRARFSASENAEPARNARFDSALQNSRAAVRKFSGPLPAGTEDPVSAELMQANNLQTAIMKQFQTVQQIAALRRESAEAEARSTEAVTQSLREQLELQKQRTRESEAALRSASERYGALTPASRNAFNEAYGRFKAGAETARDREILGSVDSNVAAQAYRREADRRGFGDTQYAKDKQAIIDANKNATDTLVNALGSATKSQKDAIEKAAKQFEIDSQKGYSDLTAALSESNKRLIAAEVAKLREEAKIREQQ